MSSIPAAGLPPLEINPPDQTLMEAMNLRDELRGQTMREAMDLMRSVDPRRAYQLQFGMRARRDAVRGINDPGWIDSGEYLTEAATSFDLDYPNSDTKQFIEEHRNRVNDYMLAIRAARDPNAAPEIAKIYKDEPNRIRQAMRDVATEPEFKYVRPVNRRDLGEQVGESFMRGVEDTGERFQTLKQMYLGGEDKRVERDIRQIREDIDPVIRPEEDAGILRRGLVGAARSVPFTAGGIGASVAGTAIGGPAGGLIAGGAFSASQMIPEAFDDYRRQGMDDRTALRAAHYTGIVEAAIENMIPFDRLAGLGNKVAAETWKQSLRQIAKETAITFGGENIEEYAQSVSRSFIGALEDRGYNKAAIEEAIGKLPTEKEIKETAVQVAFLVAPGQVVNASRSQQIRSEAVNIASKTSPEVAQAVANAAPTRQGIADALGVSPQQVRMSAAERQEAVDNAKAVVSAAPQAQETGQTIPANVPAVEATADEVAAPEISEPADVAVAAPPPVQDQPAAPPQPTDTPTEQAQAETPPAPIRRDFGLTAAEPIITGFSTKEREDDAKVNRSRGVLDDEVIAYSPVGEMPAPIRDAIQGEARRLIEIGNMAPGGMGQKRRAALERIIKDAGADKGQDVAAEKFAIMARLRGEDSGLDIKAETVLKSYGALQQREPDPLFVALGESDPIKRNEIIKSAIESIQRGEPDALANRTLAYLNEDEAAFATDADAADLLSQFLIQQSGSLGGPTATAGQTTTENSSGKEEEGQGRQGLLDQPPSETDTPPVAPNTAPGPSVTGIKNEIVDQERAARGLPPIARTIRQSDPEAWDAARAKMDSDPSYISNLLSDLEKSRRAHTKEEAAALIREKVDINHRQRKAVERLVEADAKDDPAGVSAAEQEINSLSAYRNRIDEIATDAGSTAGLNLQARKMMADDEYELVTVLAVDKATKGTNLTSDEIKKSTELAKAISEGEAAYVAQVQKVDKANTAKAADELAGKIIAKGEKKSGRRKEAEKRVSDALTELKKAIGRATGTTFSLGAADEVFAAGVNVAKAYIDLNVVRFSEFVRQLSEKLGADEVQKNIKLWRAAWDEAAQDIERPTELPEGDYAQSELARQFAEEAVASGINDRNGVLKYVHDALTEIDDKLTYDDTLEIFAGSRVFRELNKDPFKARVRELRNEAQKITKLIRLLAGRPLPKIGFERQEQTDAARELTALVEEYKKRFGVVVSDPARQLKSALSALKTRLKNRIRDLQKQIDTREKIVKTKTPLPEDAETAALRSQVAELQKQYNEIFDEKLTDEQRIEAARKSLERSIAENERRIRENDLFPEPERKLTSPQLDELRKTNAALSKAIKSMRERVLPEKPNAAEAQAEAALRSAIKSSEDELAGKKKDSKEPVTNARIAMLRDQLAVLNAIKAGRRAELESTPEWKAQNAKKQLERRLEMYEEMLRTNDILPKARVVPQLDKEALAIKKKVDEAKAEVKHRRERWAFDRKNKFEKMIESGKTATNILRSVEFGLEASVVGLQGGVRLMSNPIQTSRSFKRMIQAFMSEKAAHAAMEEIRNDPIVASGLAARSKLALVDVDATLTKQEEMYIGRIANWPITSVGRNIIRAFSRATAVFMNRLRLDAFRELYKMTSGSEEDAKVIAFATNAFTGRGNMGKAERAAELLTLTFLAPRWITSRFQVALGIPFLYGNKNTRKAVAVQYGRYLVGLAAFYFLYGLAKRGLDPEDKEPIFDWEIRSSRAFQVRVGKDYWVDPTAGLAKTITFMARMATGTTSKDTGEIVDIRGKERPHNQKSALEIFGNFFRNKLAPIPGAVVSAFVAGEDPGGNESTPMTALLGLGTPVTGKDIVQAAQSEGLPRAAAISMFALIGLNAQKNYNHGWVDVAERATADLAPRMKESEKFTKEGQAKIRARRDDINKTIKLLKDRYTFEQAVERLKEKKMSQDDFLRRREALRTRWTSVK